MRASWFSYGVPRAVFPAEKSSTGTLTSRKLIAPLHGRRAMA